MDYEFVDIFDRTASEGASVKSDALFLVDKQKTLDELVNGVISLRVNGVNEVVRSNNLVERVGNGSIYLGNRLPSKKIIYEFLLIADTASELAQKQDEINKMLVGQNDLKFSFNFMKNWYYIGNVSAIGYEPATLRPKATIEFTIFDPFKYNSESIVLSNNQTVSANTYEDKFYPEKLEINGDLSNNLTITSSSGKKIKLLANAGQGTKKYILDFSTGVLTANDVELNGLIDVSSDIFDFYIAKGGNFTVSSSIDTKMIIRAKEVG